MTMTDSTGNYRMNQLLYLVSDGEDGYLITATFPEDGEPDLKLKQEIMQVIESFKLFKHALCESKEIKSLAVKQSQ